MVAMVSSCESEDKKEVVTVGNTDIHVAFAGGGWRAHTGHAAWVMSLLESNDNTSGCTLSGTSGNPQCLESAFTNVKTISGNSGGSWFSTMLMYDPDFINQITNKDAILNWGSTDMLNPNQGWLGKQQDYFSAFNGSCGTKHGAKYLECILESYFYTGSSHLPSPNWSMFVENLVYKGYNWQAYGVLDSNTHQPWATDKSLLMAGSLLTNAVVLNDQGENYDEIFYQVCLQPDQIHMDKDNGSWCLNPSGTRVSTNDVIPVTFTSLAEGVSTLVAPSFISTDSSLLNLGYSQAWCSSGPFCHEQAPVNQNTIQSGINSTGNVPVMWASAASSAAVGYTASYDHAVSCGLTTWDCTYHSRGLALGFEIPESTNQVELVPYGILDGMAFDDLSTDRVVRVADGGVVDNSGIAQLIGYLQLNDQDDGFNIVAFDDVQINDSSGDNANFPSSDISYMFNGAPSEGICFDGVCVSVPELAILEFNPASSSPVTKYTWTVIDSTGQETTDSLHYYTYEVQTIANPNFGIQSGSTGTIHVFASEFECADTAPENNQDLSLIHI